MFTSLPPSLQYRLQYALAIAAVVAGVAAVITLILTGLVLVFASLPYGHPLALYMPQLHVTPAMMPRGSLGSAAWMALLMAYSGLAVGIIAFVILYLGRADAN